MLTSNVYKISADLICQTFLFYSRVKYENGEIIEGPTAIAGNQGTTITFDDIFYNSPIQLKTLGLASEEFQKVFDVVAKYAVHNCKVSFTLKKFGENNSIKTLSSTSPIDTIRIIYGNNVANSLLDVKFSHDNLKFSMNGFISKGDYSGKKRHFLLFINHRLVESKSLKKAIFDEVYNALLPNNVHPFVYMSLEMDPMNLDVNVSPTKHEVNFLNEDAIVEKIKEAVEEKLLDVNDTRKLYTQQLLPGASAVPDEKSFEEREKIYAKDMVRTDSKTQTIVKFLDAKSSSQGYHSQSPKNTSHLNPNLGMNRSKSKMATLLTSINELKIEIDGECDEGLREQLSNLKFVGIANKSKALVQCENFLYLCNTQRLSQELFYQQSVRNFENFDSIEFEESLKIYELALIGFDLKECGYEEADGSKKELAKQVEKILLEQRQMLSEYFSMTINDDAKIESLPRIIQSHVPLMAHLPIFIIRMATEVNYEDEKICFKTICDELAAYYSKLPLTSSECDLQYLSENIIYPEIMKKLSPPKKFLTDGTLLKLTSLQELYKVFERC